MIRLDLKDYCHHGCMNFEPKVSEEKIYAENYEAVGDVIIRCANAKVCDYMYRYLKNHASEDFLQ